MFPNISGWIWIGVGISAAIFAYFYPWEESKEQLNRSKPIEQWYPETRRKDNDSWELFKLLFFDKWIIAAILFVIAVNIIAE